MECFVWSLYHEDKSYSHTNQVLSDLQWFLFGIIRVSSDEILKQKLWISKVTSVILEWLSMASDKSLLKISGVPNPFFHVVTFEGICSFLDKFISSHLNVLIEEVATENLLSVLIVYHLWVEESISKNSFVDKLHVSIVEHDIIVIQE